jgi:hypothetical protein
MSAPPIIKKYISSKFVRKIKFKIIIQGDQNANQQGGQKKLSFKTSNFHDL